MAKKKVSLPKMKKTKYSSISSGDSIDKLMKMKIGKVKMPMMSKTKKKK
jgi:hypothetical protein